jgi:hypothetical protein
MLAIYRSRIVLCALAMLAALPLRAAATDDPAASPSPTPPAVTACRIVDASLTAGLDSKTARDGQVFHFTATPSEGQQSADGFGVVDFVHGAGRGGKAGQIGLETRFLRLTDGTHLAATIVPDDGDPSVFNGRSRNAPFFLSALGLAKGSGFHIAAGVVGFYDFVHSGGQAVIPAGTHLRIVLGDDYLTGGCSIRREYRQAGGTVG